MCTKRQSPKIYEANTDRNEGRNVPIIIVGEFNTPLSIMNKISRKKINKDIEDCHYKPPKLNIHIKTLHLMTAEYIFFSNSKG